VATTPPVWLERIAEGSRVADSLVAVQLLAPRAPASRHEELRILYLDAGMHPLRIGHVRDQTITTVDLPLRKVILAALQLDAGAMILAHNHPGGRATPSPADRAVTRRVGDVARQLDIQLVDHLIFAGDAVTSFRALGLL
jgi:DNA repair protein RadC